MTAPLHLAITDYKDEAHWRWALTDAKGNLLADHEVSLDTSAPEYRGYCDLPDYLDFYAPIKSQEQLLHELGEWIGVQIFGGLTNVLREQRDDPATVVRVNIPPEAQALLLRPFELAYLDGQSFAERGIRFVYQALSLTPPPILGEGKGVGDTLRVLAIFSLPTDERPLNLRRERYLLKQLLDEIAQTRGAAIKLRILQYGTTRQTLTDALAEGQGWDVIHFSGHGLKGESVLENERGEADCLTAQDLVPLLRPTRSRLKLLTLSACLSGAGTVQEARAQLGLDRLPTRAASAEASALPSLAQKLVSELDCAALAMRYPVGDEFSVNLALALYRLLLEKGQPLPGALQLALAQALAPDKRDVAPPLSLVTPILFGPRAADLTLTPPKRPPSFELPKTGLFNFPSEPERFVGRLLPMLRASQALAPASDYRGMLFYGMAGAGKTTCALELAYRHEQERFTGYVWHKAPDEGHDIATALGDFLQDVEAQLDMRDLALTADVDDPVRFERRTLPRLKQMLSDNAILIVLDNIESLLTSSGQWRDSKWGALMEKALLSHTGTSRVVLTSRRLPATLQNHPALLREPIHALSLSESVLLARELPNLRKLFGDAQGRELLRRALNVIQGHPKLLDLADRRAADPAALKQQVALSESEVADRDALLRAFFDTGETRQGEENFVTTLRGWTTSLTATLPPTARLLFHFLCRLEDPDRRSDIIAANWKDFLNRLAPLVGAAGDVADAALSEPGLGLESSLALLVTSGLIESRPLPSPDSSGEGQGERAFRLHPAVAEAGCAEADTATLDAADIELGDFWIVMYQRGMETEMQGGTPLVVEAGRRAAPYLMRAQRWGDAATLLERVTQRDKTPATLAMALPLLRQIVQATEGTTEGLENAGVLANALLKAGRYAEAEQMQRDLMDKCVAQGDYRSASANAGYLLNLLVATGRLQDALVLSGQMAEFTRRAQLGPWTQLAAEGMRLQILNALGRYQEVLDAVQRLRGQMATLPEQSQVEEIASPWNVRESLLNTGGRAAMGLEQWETMLDLNAEVVRFQQARGVDEVKLADTRFNDHFPLLRLRRYKEARALLKYCRAVYEQAHAIPQLGSVYSALADLEDEEGHRAAAVQFEQIALCYRYQAGQPEDCAISHNNLASYLQRTLAAPEIVMAHGLADALICFQIGSGGLATSIRNLANSTLPAAPPTFEEVVATAEQIEGVRFREMFAHLPARAPGGDEAIAVVWKMMKEAKSKT